MSLSLQYIYNAFNDASRTTDPCGLIHETIKKLVGDILPPADDNIYVMTYNVYFIAMKDSIRVNNIANIINNKVTWDNTHTSTHPGTFDFIATQESSDEWKTLYKLLDDTKYGYCNSHDHHKGNTKPNPVVNHVTYYNKTKYEIVKDTNGVQIVNPFGSIRAKHCILFQNIKTKVNYLFINLHNSHKINSQQRNVLIDDINNAVKNIKVHYSNIIVAGDFNDEGRAYHTGFDIQPSIHTSIKPPNPANIHVKCEIHPPKSLPGKDTCDYVISNLPIQQIFVPLSEEWKNKNTHPQSDHFPVVAVLRHTS